MLVHSVPTQEKRANMMSGSGQVRRSGIPSCNALDAFCSPVLLRSPVSKDREGACLLTSDLNGLSGSPKQEQSACLPPYPDSTWWHLPVWQECSQPNRLHGKNGPLISRSSDHSATALEVGRESTFASERHDNIRIVIARSEDSGILGIDQLGGDGHGIVQRLALDQVAWVECDLDRLSLVRDRQIDMRAAHVGRRAGELEQAGAELEIDTAAVVTGDDRCLFNGQCKRPTSSGILTSIFAGKTS